VDVRHHLARHRRHRLRHRLRPARARRRPRAARRRTHPATVGRAALAARYRQARAAFDVAQRARFTAVAHRGGVGRSPAHRVALARRHRQRRARDGQCRQWGAGDRQAVVRAACRAGVGRGRDRTAVAAGTRAGSHLDRAAGCVGRAVAGRSGDGRVGAGAVADRTGGGLAAIAQGAAHRGSRRAGRRCHARATRQAQGRRRQGGVDDQAIAGRAAAAGVRRGRQRAAVGACRRAGGDFHRAAGRACRTCPGRTAGRGAAAAGIADRTRRRAAGVNFRPYGAISFSA